MTSILTVLTSVVSLFFSLIFSTMIFQRKAWNQIYISLSLFFISLTSFSFFIGEFFTWYEWNLSLFLFSYALIIPLLFGLVIVRVSTTIYKPWRVWISLGYGYLLLVVTAFYVNDVLPIDFHEVLKKEQIYTQGWATDELAAYAWSIAFLSILLTLGSLFLWIRRQGIAWFWFALSGLMFFAKETLVEQELMTPILFSIFLFLLMIMIWQGSKKLLDIYQKE